MRLQDAWNFRQRPYGTAADGPPETSVVDAGPGERKVRFPWRPWRSGVVDPAGRGVGAGSRGSLHDAPAQETADPVHDALKGVDVWFGHEIHALEQEARDLAEQHALLGQPRHDLRRDGPLEMELLLEKRGAGILHQWITRVRRGLQGAVETETERLRGSLAAAREAIQGAETARDELMASRVAHPPALHLFPAAVAPEAGATAPSGPVIESERHLGGFGFWTLMVLLVVADFLANAPLFTELFPANRAVDEALSAWEEVALADGGLLSFGPAHLVVRLSAHMEATLLALSVVVFFVFLGHALGANARTLVALRRHRRSSSALGDASRQAWLPVLLSLVGIGCTVTVLYLARGHVEPMANARVEQVASELTQAGAAYEQALEDPDNLPAIARARSQLARLEEERVYRVARHDYARSVEAMNLPILGLNIVLVIAAIVAGFLHTKKRYVVDPRLAAAEASRRRETVLRATFVERCREAHQALGSAGRSRARIGHLLSCDVTSDWTAKAGRIQEAISLFRIENARLRHLDVTDIAAFHTPFTMRLPTPEGAGIELEAPAALPEYADEHVRLQAAMESAVAQAPEGARGEASIRMEGTHG